MTNELSDLVDKVSEIYKKECKACKENRKIMSRCEFIGLKNNELCYKCEKCNKIWLQSINGLIKKFPKMYQFCSGDINKFVLLLREVVYSRSSMHSTNKMRHRIWKYQCVIEFNKLPTWYW